MRGTCEQDGYALHYEVRGRGPRIVWVDPALGSSAARPLSEAVEELAGGFEVVTYDRRGRGANADVTASTPELEVADLRSIVEEVSGAAAVVGFSSGAALVLHAAPGLAASRLVLVEPAVDAEPDPGGLRDVVAGLLARGDLEAATRAFYAAVGVPEEALEDLVGSDSWPGVVRSAATLLADLDLSVVDDDAVAAVDRPVDVVVSAGSPDEITAMGEQLAGRLGAPLWQEPGGWHGVDPAALAARLRRLVRPSD